MTGRHGSAGSAAHGAGGSAGGTWAQRLARTAPRPVRVFFTAQVGFDAWRAELAADPDRHAIALRGVARLALALALAGVLGAATVAAPAPVVTVGLGVNADGVPVTPLPPGAVAARLAAGQPPPVLPLTPGDPAGETDAAAVVPTPVVPAQRGALPVGKGMWIWLADQAEGGDPGAIVARAQDVGLTHLYVRTASLREGFYAAGLLDALLPVAHAANIRVYAWDFPYLDDPGGDVARALAAISHTTADGHRVDGYVADIELPSMGVNVTPATAMAFGEGLRRAVGPNYPLIACVPRPSAGMADYPFAEVVHAFDAIAPMVYWLDRDPIGDIVGALRDLSPFGKPILPVGQAYDGGPEGGRRGVPPREELIRFMQAGDRQGVPAVSWWSWQHADQEAWDAIRDAAEFRLPVGDPAGFNRGQVQAYQTLVSSLGFVAPIDGTWGRATTDAVVAYQQAARLPLTGVIDELTRAILLTPFAPPIQPQG